MTEIAKHEQPGLTDTFTRLFSIITIVFGILFFTGIMDPPFEGAENLDIILLLLVLHGVITNPVSSGELRKLLCHISGATATALIIYSIVLFFVRLGLVSNDF